MANNICEWILQLLSEANITGSVNYKDYAEQFICNCIQKGNQNWKLTKGGLLWYLNFNNLQYVNSASFIIITYAQQLQKANKTMHCPSGEVNPRDLVTFVKSQVSTNIWRSINGLENLCALFDAYAGLLLNRLIMFLGLTQKTQVTW